MPFYRYLYGLVSFTLKSRASFGFMHKIAILFYWYMFSSHSFSNTIRITQIAVALHIMLHLYHPGFCRAWMLLRFLNIPFYRYPFGMVSFPLKSMRSFGFTHQINTDSLTRYTTPEWCFSLLWFASCFFRTQLFNYFVPREAICVAKNITLPCIGMLCQRLAKCLQIK